MAKTGENAEDGGENRISFKSDVERLQQTRRVYRSAQDLTNKLESIFRHKQAYRVVFEKDAIEMRMRLRDLCERLMLLHPIDFGRKAEEILWWKVYYNVINLAKKSKKYIRRGSALECAYRTHLLAATGFYHHLLMRLQWEYGLQDDHVMDFISFPDHDQARDTGIDANKPDAKDWAQKACHRCLIYLGDLARYRQDFEGPSSRLLAERFYHQALLLNPAMGMPHNQLGTLAGTRYQGVDAAYHYLRCWLSDLRFDGAIANLEKVFERNQKRYHELPMTFAPDLPSELMRPRDIKHFLIRFLYLQEMLQPSNKSALDSLPALCQEVLQSFHQCMLHGAPPNGYVGGEEGREGYLSNDIVFKLVVLTLMSTYRLQKAGSKQTSTAVVFTLALFSYTLNHLCEKLNSALYRKMYPEQVTATPSHKAQADSDISTDGRASPANTITGPLAASQHDIDSDGTVKATPGKKKVHAHDEKTKKVKGALKGVRRKRRKREAAELGVRASSESDLSEGGGGGGMDGKEDEDIDDGGGERRRRRQAGSDGSSGDSDGEERGGAGLLESDSDYMMDSQELEEAEEDEAAEKHTHQESPSPLPDSSQDGALSDMSDMSSQMFAPPPGPTHTPPGRRSIRLAPSFDAYTKETGVAGSTVGAKEEGGGGFSTPRDSPSGRGKKSASTSPTANQACSPELIASEIPLPIKMETLTSEGLLPVVKILTDWLRTNEDFIVKTAQSSQPLWARLASLLNMCPNEKQIVNQDWCRTTSLRQALEGSQTSLDGRSWHQPIPLTEDTAIWTMPPLQYLQKKMKYDVHHQLDLNPQEETVVRVICLRQFGYFLTGIDGISLMYEEGQFSSPAYTQTEEEEEDDEDDEGRRAFPRDHTAGNVDDDEDVLKTNQAEEKKGEEKEKAEEKEAEERRQQVMRGMAQLRLQSEVSQLEGTIEPLGMDPLSPYLILDTGVLTNQMAVVKSLVATSRFIFIIPKAVTSQLDVNKKFQPRARDAIKFMEKEFQLGNRYLRAQQDNESLALTDKAPSKTDDKNIRTFCSIAECALFFAKRPAGAPAPTAAPDDQDSVISPTPGGMVTILTDQEPGSSDHPSLTAALDKLLTAGVDVTTAEDFMAKWQQAYT